MSIRHELRPARRHVGTAGLEAEPRGRATRPQRRRPADGDLVPARDGGARERQQRLQVALAAREREQQRARRRPVSGRYGRGRTRKARPACEVAANTRCAIGVSARKCLSCTPATSSSTPRRRSPASAAAAGATQALRWLTRRPRACTRLLSLDQELGSERRPPPAAGARTAGDPARLDRRHRRVREGRDVRRRFRPPSISRGRWQRLWMAARRGSPLPPISVVALGEQHFVVDGHHRVSVAHSLGMARSTPR